MSDSNPFFAFIFKLLGFPSEYQYVGIWYLLCFILQSIYAYKLISLFSPDKYIRFVCVLFFLFSPPMLWRLQMHETLVAHFLILMSFYFIFGKDVTNIKLKWMGLIVMASMIHSYLLLMVLVLWFSNLCDKYYSKSISFKVAFYDCLLVAIILLLSCWLVGYFSVGSGMVSGGFGYYRMNLLSIVNPFGWSNIIKDFHTGAGDYEGFNFLGLGIILLVLFQLPIIWLKHLDGKLNFSFFFAHRFLLTALFLLFVYSLSNNVGFGLYTLHYHLPASIEKFANIFRASGRLFWPVYYAIFLSVMYGIVRFFPKTIALSFLIAAVLIQVIDTYSGWVNIRNILMTQSSSKLSTKFNDYSWGSLVKHYSKLRLIMPENNSPNWSDISILALNNNMPTDAVYLGRMDGSKLNRLIEKDKKIIESGLFERDTLYFVDDKYLHNIISHMDNKKDLLFKLDGVFVLAPNYKLCKDCPVIDQQIDLDSFFPKISLGERVNIKSGSKYISLLSYGWSLPEEWGIWSVGDESVFSIPYNMVGDVNNIILYGRGFVSDVHPRQVVNVMINDVSAGDTILDKNTENTISVALSKEMRDSAKINKFYVIKLKYPNSVSPKDVGFNDDTRKLSFGLNGIKVL